MANRTYTVYQNIYSREIFDINGDALANDFIPYIATGEVIILDYNAITSDTITDTYTGWAAIAISPSAVFDNDFKHFISGTLSANAPAGATVAIEATVTDTDFINPTGIIQLTNSSGLSESIDYTAYSQVGTTYTFTVSVTLSNSYVIGDTSKVGDTPLGRATAIDQTDKATGRLLITIDADSLKYFTEAASSAEIKNCALELQVLDSGANVIFINEFPILCFNVRDYTGVIPAPANGDYYTKIEVDALLTAYLKSDFSLLSTKATIVDADTIAGNDSEDSGNPVVLTFTKVTTYLTTSLATVFLLKLWTGFAGKTTPVDADLIAINDSAASFAPKKLTWANLKATLKTYFDTLYSKLVPTPTINHLLITDAAGQPQDSGVTLSSVVGGMIYQGTWNATTNTPTIVSSTGTQGHYYVVSVAGTTTIDGISDWEINDWIVFNGATWEKIDNSESEVTASDVTVEEIGTSTYDDVQDWLNNTQSAGIFSGGDVTDGGSGTVDVSAVKGFVKSTVSGIGVSKSFDLTGLTGQALADEDTNYIAVDYNSGTPQWVVGTSDTSNGYTIFNRAKVYREGSTLDIISTGLDVTDFANRVQAHHIAEAMLHFTSGATVTETGTINIAISAGVMYSGLNDILTDSIDTSKTDDITGGGTGGTISANNTIVLDSGEGDVTADYELCNHLVVENSSNGNDGSYNVMSSSWDGTNTTVIITESTLSTGADTGNVRPFSFEYYYNDGAWQEADETQIDNLQYNNYGVGLATLSNNQYGVHWVYKGTNSTSYVVYGIASYTLTGAQLVQPPANIPPHVLGFGVLRAKIIIAKSGVVFTEIESVDDTQFSSSTPTNHNDLGQLNTGDYRHLTLAEKTIATQAASVTVAGYVDTGAQTFAGAKTFPSVLNLSSTTYTFGSNGVLFGDGDSSIYESSDDNFTFRLAGINSFQMNASQFWSIAGGGSIINQMPSATNPTIVPTNGDADTGFGWISSGVFSLISNATNIANVLPTGIEILNTLTVDTINEYTLDAGVTIDSCLIKDGAVADINIPALTTEASPATGMYLIIDNAGTRKKVNWSSLPGSGGGEVNTASNTGSTGLGLYKTKSTLDLQFYKVLGSNGISFALNGTDYIDVKMDTMTTQGDIIYGGASGLPTRLAKGTAAQVLTMNTGATAPEWADSAEPVDTVVTLSTTGNWEVPAGVTMLKEVYIIAGGGGGGSGENGPCGGGAGAGGVKLLTNVRVTPAETLAYTIGAGGAGATVSKAAGAIGGDSDMVFNGITYTSEGGGGGGGNNDVTALSLDGGSGGGGLNNANGSGGVGVPATLGQIDVILGLGNDGGVGVATTGAGCGGGGYYTAGSETPIAGISDGGDGGLGLDLSKYTGLTSYAGGGGGGGGYSGTRVGGTGVDGGGDGGDGGTTTTNGSNADAYGGGGGGSGADATATPYDGGNGYQGAIFIIY